MKQQNKKSAVLPIIVSLLSISAVAFILELLYLQTFYLPFRLVASLCFMLVLVNVILTLFRTKSKPPNNKKQDVDLEKSKKNFIKGVLKKFGNIQTKTASFFNKNRTVVVFLLLIVTIALYQLYFFSMLTRITSLATLNYMFLVFMLIAFISFIILEKWCAHVQMDNESYSAILHNVRVSVIVCRYALLLTSVSMAVKLLGFYDSQKWLVYILIGLWIYTCVFVLLSILVKTIKKEILTNPKLIIPIPFAKNLDNEFGVLTYLENNTGITMRSLWSIRMVKGIIPYLVLICISLFWFSTGIVQVESYQEGAIYRFGRLKEEPLSPGLHFTLPWPVDKVVLYDTKNVNQIIIGYKSQSDTDNTWTLNHALNEYKLLLGSGNELVSINLRLEYNIDDLHKYLRSSASPEKLLEALAYEIVTDRTINANLEELLTLDRGAFAEEYKNELTKKMQSYQTGMSIVSVVLESIHPPVNVADVYQQTVSAEIDAYRYILNAQAKAAVTLADAIAKKDTAIGSANALYYTNLAKAKSDVASFMASVEADNQSSDAYRYYKYLDALEAAYGNSKLVIVGEGIDSSNIYFGNNFIVK